MNRLIAWVYRHPVRDRRRRRSPSCCRSRGDGPAPLRDELHQPVPARDAGSSGTTTPSSRGSGGSAWSSWSCRSATTIDAPRARPSSGGSSGRSRRSRSRTRPQVAQVLSLATVLDPDGRLAGAARRGERPDAGHQARPDRRLAPGRAAQGASGTPRPARRGVLVRLLGAAARARQGGRSSSGPRPRPARRFGPTIVPDRPVVPDDPDDRGDHRHPVGHVLLVGWRASC